MKTAVFITSAGWMGVRASDTGLTDIVLPKRSRVAALRGLRPAFSL